MASKIVFTVPGESYTTDVTVTESLDTVHGNLSSALGQGEKFIVVTRADGDDEGKRFTIKADGVLSVREA